jgi:hypothetical protein
MSRLLLGWMKYGQAPGLLLSRSPMGALCALAEGGFLPEFSKEAAMISLLFCIS